jgi:hypothetical protein
MAQEWLKKYLTMKPEVSKVFDDLEAYHDYCRIQLCEFNPAHLYDRANVNYKGFLDSQRPRRPWVDRGERKPYQGKNPRPQYNNDRFSR